MKNSLKKGDPHFIKNEDNSANELEILLNDIEDAKKISGECKINKNVIKNLKLLRNKKGKFNEAPDILGDIFFSKEELINVLESRDIIYKEKSKKKILNVYKRFLSHDVFGAVLDHDWVEDFKGKNFRFILDTYDTGDSKINYALEINLKGDIIIIDKPDEELVQKIENYLKQRPGEKFPFDRDFNFDCLIDMKLDSNAQDD